MVGNDVVVESRDWWVVAVTAWPVPDAEHRLIIKLTRSHLAGTESRAVTSIGQACMVLTDWLKELDSDSDEGATGSR